MFKYFKLFVCRCLIYQERSQPPTFSCPEIGLFCCSYFSILYCEQRTMGDASASSTTGLAACSGLGDRGARRGVGLLVVHGRAAHGARGRHRLWKGRRKRRRRRWRRGHGRFTFDCLVMKTLFLNQSQYVLKMMAIWHVDGVLHPNIGRIFLSPA